MNTINQFDLIDVYRTLHPIMAKSTFFSNKHGAPTQTDYTLGPKTNPDTLKRINVI